jgi:alpha-tubulin suppressor-like RCC1 family protein
MKSSIERTMLRSFGFASLLASGTILLNAQQSSLVISPANPSIRVGQTQQFTQSGALTITAIAAGGGHSCMLLSDGTARCVGRDSQGQLGDGSYINEVNPVAVSGLAGATQIGAGSEHTCALISDGTMRCWGTNYTGQLGMGGATGEHGGVPFSLSPVQVQGITNAIVSAPGGFHTCAVLADHTVQCWGRNQDGQLGNGDSTTDTSLPGPVSGLGAVAALSPGGYHNCALMPDGTVRCWGRNDDGQLGTGDRTRATTPVQVNGLSAAPVAVSAGGYHTCALMPDGTVQCWGRNVNGQVGQPSSTGAFPVPTTVPGIAGAVSIKTGFYNTCATLADRTLRCWGENDFGEVGDGSVTSVSAPTQVADISGASAVAVGGWHSCALVADNSLRCWGLNDGGQLGNGTTTNSPGAVKMNGTGLTWSSSNPAVATVDAGGLARAAGRGTTTITVTDASGNSGSTTLTVTDLAALSVMRQGTGSGSVVSSPAGIDCGSTCSASFNADSQVTLTATAASGSSFTGWTGCDGASGTTCTVTMSAARSVAATFDKVLYTLTVNRADAGSGSVTSTPDGINCGADCSEPYTNGTSVTLTAAAASGSRFTGWSGCDSVSGATCTVAMNAARTVTATFKLLYTLTVAKADLGSGTVTASPAGINCGADCTEPYVSGTAVTLTAVAASGSRLTGWSGCDSVSGSTCTVTMNAARNVTATFKLLYTLTVAKTDLGSGVVTANPAGINCGADCTEPYVSGTTVTLTATAAAGSRFMGWSGCDSVTGASCTVSMSAARTVTATFKLLFTLTVNKTGLGKGTITSNPAGISCGADCSEPYVSGTTVTLTVAPQLGSVFLFGWSGCDSVSGLTGEVCTVRMSNAKAVTANFVLGTPF